MRIVLQRVKSAYVSVNDKIVGHINKGVVLLVGVTHNDNEDSAKWLADKCVNLRIFPDDNNKMNLSLKDVNGEILVISQFTVYGDCQHGRRPGFSDAAEPVFAQNLYEKFVKFLKQSRLKVETGVFQEMMLVQINNDGPVTFILEK